MTNQKDLDDLKSVIVSQLATRKPLTRIPLDAIAKDYSELNYEHIPYHKFGFSTLVDFLKTIPEVEVYRTGGYYYLDFKGKESFKHVTELVANTKRKINRNFKGQTGYRSRSVSTRKSVPPGYKPPQDYNRSYGHTRPSQDYSRPHESSSSSQSIDPTVTNQILSIIKEHPGGLLQSEVLDKLRLRYPYTSLNINQVQEHLNSLDREIMITNNLIYPRRSSPQESFAQKSSRSQSVPSRRQSQYPEESNGYNMSFNSNGQDYNNAGNDYGNNNNGNNNYTQNCLPKKFKIAGLDSDDDAADYNPDLDADFDSAPSLTSSEINGYRAVKDMKANEPLYDVNSSKQVEMANDSREVKEQQKINYDSSRHDSGYNNAERTDYNNLNNDYREQRRSKYHQEVELMDTTADYVDTDAAGAKQVNKEDLIQKTQSFVADSLSERTKLRLLKLLENNPNGIWCLELPELYEKEYRLRLEWEDFGIHRLSDFVSHLPEIFHKLGPYQRGDYRLFDARKPIPEEGYDKQMQQRQLTALYYNVYGEVEYNESVPRYLTRDMKQKLCPDGVLTIDETVGYISVSKFQPTLDEGGEKKHMPIAVFVVEAFDPSFFWIQFSENKKRFDQMMESLGLYYSDTKNSSRYRIPPIMLERGLNVACRFYGTWHRGIIKSVSPSHSSIKILFYDFGTLKSYHAHELFFLKRSFGVLPAQAIPCGLCGIAPKIRPDEERGWSKVARDTFVKMAFKCEMWATIFKVDVDNNSMLIGLTDTSEAEDIHLADFLLRSHLAERSNTDYVVNPNDLSLYVEDYGEDTPILPESPQTLTPVIPSTPNIAMSASPSIQNLSIVANSYTPTILAASKWEISKDKILQVLDDYTQSAVKVYKSMLVADRESLAFDIIKDSLYDAYAKLLYQAFCPTSHSATATITNTPNHSVCENPPQVHDLQCGADQSLSEIRSIAESDATLTNEKEDLVCEDSIISLPTGSQIDTARIQLENSISKASQSFFNKLDAQRSLMKSSNSLISELIETNPFKLDLMSAESQDSVPPPLPPRPKKLEPVVPGPKSSFAVYSPSPVMYDIPEKSTDEFSDYTNDKHNEESYSSVTVMSSDDKQADATELLNYIPVPVYNNVLINPVGINKQRHIKYDEDSWDSRSSYSICGPIDETSAESIERDSSHSYDDVRKLTEEPIDDLAANEEISYSIPFNTVELSETYVDIYILDNEGWILMDQYRSAFTVYDDNKFIYTTINLKYINLPIRQITAQEYPDIFERYNRFNEKLRESDIDVLDLIPITNLFKLSQKLSVVSRDEIEKLKNKNYDYQHSNKMNDLIRLISRSQQFVSEHKALNY